MEPSNRQGARGRRAWSLERLEGRDLPSVVPYMMHAAAVAHPSVSALALADAQAQAQQTPGTPQLTPLELRRQRFVAKFAGSFGVGPPHYTDQIATIRADGSGSSNQSFHANLQLVYFLPADPSGAVTGVAVVFPKNVATTGSTLALDLTAVPGGAIEHGFPTQFTWTVDSNSGGIYLAAGGFGTGTGTLSISYKPSTKANLKGNVSVSIQGLINGGGVFSDIQTPGNKPKGG